jgi:LysM repeat protein
MVASFNKTSPMHVSTLLMGRFALFFTVSLIVAFTALAERVHLVQKNETLGGIARKYGVSSNALQAINGIKDANLLFVGKKLKIPDGTASEVPYVVKKGDSLGAIAARFGAKASDISARNQLASANLIKVGQKLIIPLSKGGTSTYKPPPPLLDAKNLKTLGGIRPTPGKWKKIIIHHSATNVDDAVNIHNVHKARGMQNGLAYHFVISNGSRKAKDGEIYFGGRWKGQLDGGHVKKQSWNKTTIGICLIGNFETRRPTTKQLKVLEGLCRYLMKRCKISAKNVITHKVLHPGHTLCPGKLFPITGFKKKLSAIWAG